MLINKFRKKSSSSSSTNKQSQASMMKEQDLLGHPSFQTYPSFLSKLDHPSQFSSLGHKKTVHIHHQDTLHHQKDNHHQLSNKPKLTNGSTTVSFHPTDTAALSHSVQTSSSSSSNSSSSLISAAPSPLPTPTASPPAIFDHKTDPSIHPTPSSSSLNNTTPRPTPLAAATIDTTTTLTTATTASTVQFAKWIPDGDDDAPTIVGPGGDSPAHQQSDQPQPNRVQAQSVPSGRHQSESTSDAIQENHQLSPSNPQVPTSPRAFSQYTPASSNRSSLSAHAIRSDRPTSLVSIDPSAQVRPFNPARVSDQSVDSVSSRPFKKIGRCHLRRSKTDHSRTAGGIATAIAFSGVSLAPYSTSVSLAGNMKSKSTSTLGSTRSHEEIDNQSINTTDSRHWAHTASSSNDGHLGTGYAVASRKRNAEFHAIFKSIPVDDYLIEDYGCALQRDILVQGRIYISEKHLCFKANIFGWVTTLVVPFSDVASIEKRMTALIIPNAIQVITTQSRHTFASFLTRDTAYDMMKTIWRITNPAGVNLSFGLNHGEAHSSNSASEDGVQVEYQDPSSTFSNSSTPVLTKKREHSVTQCDCSPETHGKELVWDATYPISPEKLYNILFQSDFLKDFWVNEEHLTEIEVGDWTTAPDAKFPSRNMSYIRPLNAPVGPKAIKCLLVEEHLALDFDKYVSIMSTTRTPDAPAGGGFCVKTLSCITWQPNNSSRWLVTTGVEWTKVNRFLKSIIESSTITGQKTYQAAVDQALRNHIQLSRVEPSIDRSDIEATSTGVKTDEAVRFADELKKTPTMSRRDETEAQSNSQVSANSSIFKIKSPSQAILRGTQSSWMMMVSIGLAVLLLVANLMTVKRGGQVVTMDQEAFQGEHSDFRGHRVKPQLTEDVAQTVKEALQQYFRDHSDHTSKTKFEHPIGNSPLHTSGIAAGELGLESKKTQAFAVEEIAEIETLLESLENRIRNIRKSLVNERRQ